MKALEGAFNQEKALVEAFSMIVQLHQLIVCSTSLHPRLPCSELTGVPLLGVRSLKRIKNALVTIDYGENWSSELML